MPLFNKRHFIILLITASILLIPLIGMQFSSEVNWSITDFIMAGLLLFGTGILIEFTLRKTKNTNNRRALIAVIVVVLLLIWAELAVGIFGSPLAGN